MSVHKLIKLLLNYSLVITLQKHVSRFVLNLKTLLEMLFRSDVF
jgi:hypothetical protein